MNKLIRRVGSKPLNALEIWDPSKEETLIHNIKIAEGDIPPDYPLKINWKVRFQKIATCCFILPKYRQLIYWITTNTLCTGKRIHQYSARGFCPFCSDGTVANWMHMFFECPTTVEVWKNINELGSVHWRDYTPLVPNEIPVLLNNYDPVNLLHLSTLWALWVQWCSYFHEEDFPYSDIGVWVAQIMTKARDEFRARLYESCSAIQWLHLVAERRSTPSDPDAPVRAKISEKEFLLVHSNTIITNSDHINLNGSSLSQEIIHWIGNGVLISMEGEAQRPKLKFNIYLWDIYTRPPDCRLPRDYQADDWVIRPRFCVGDF